MTKRILGFIHTELLAITIALMDIAWNGNRIQEVLVHGPISPVPLSTTHSSV